VAVQNMPAAEIEITVDLVQALIAEQHPDLADLALSPVATGWDNAIFRLGPTLTVRVPRRQLGADLVEHEHRWLPGMAKHLPIPIAAPLRTGLPTNSFPWSWSICRWFDGEVAADVVLSDPIVDAQRLGAFVAALHQPAPANAPVNPLRGQPIAELRPRIVSNVELLGAHVDGPSVLASFERLAAVDEWPGEPLWLHGDLHAANMVVYEGSISAVLDFGDVTSGDPAVDLAFAWMLFDDEGRSVLRAAAGGIDDATWSRAQAWALHFALLYILNSADNDRFARMGTSLLATVLAVDGGAP
jgi:aminoglycoside phosphotransferase (APT) family kinase protein